MEKDLDQEIKIITRQPAERLSRFRALSLPEQSVVFQQLSQYIQQLLLQEMKVGEIVDLVDHLDPRQAEKVLLRIKDNKRRLKIVKRVKVEIRDKVEYFLCFHPKATRSLVNFNYVLLSDKATIGEAADAIEDHYHNTGKFL